MEDYDYLIVGAGLAGLHSALRLAKLYPKARIAIAEAYDYNGGRVVSYHKHGLHVENGAGRIHSSHKMTLGYIDKYKLTTLPISSHQSWRSQVTKKEEENIWPNLSLLLHQLLGSLRPALLASHTVYELLEQTVGRASARRIVNRFPYRAETFVLRADLALKSFEQEMGSGEDFWVVKEGLSAMIEGMVSELEQMDVEMNHDKRASSTNSSVVASSARRIQFFYNHKLYHVQDKCAWFKVNGKQVYCTAKKIILALHNAALKKINPFSNLPLLKKVIMCPLLRIYAKFPTHNGKSWFSDMNHCVTDSPLRYIIPINPKEGVIMISYTDAQDTLHWTDILRERGEKAVEREIMKKVRELFPGIEIPDPIFFKMFPWDEGCSYWAPGTYNPREFSRKAHHPIPELLPNVYLCGESYSMKQCWMEGALEHAEELIQRYFTH